MNKQLYPLKFEPVLKDKIWGGVKLQKLFGKKAHSDKLGESWELSGIENDETIVTNGFLAGRNLAELVAMYKGALVGDRVYKSYGLSFPLLFKLIDANDNLSIQVHPGDGLAAERHNSFGKTEMWYVVDADPGASLIIGFSKDCDKKNYLDALKSGRVEELLQKVPVQKGDVLFIPAGLVHAIGKGVVVAEIQQSSDITYRIYDYKRTDENGNERELHTEQALDVIDFSAATQPKVLYHAAINEITPLVRCDYFSTNMIRFNTMLSRNYDNPDTFVVYMCMEGTLIIESGDGSARIPLLKGETVLIPAAINEVVLIPDGEVCLMEVYRE